MTSTRPILALAVGDERVASVRYRVLAHSPALAAAGFPMRLRVPWEAPTAIGRIGRLLDLLRDAAGRDSEEILLVHRKTYPRPFARRLPRVGRRILFDFDDAIDMPPPGRPMDPAITRRFVANFTATVHVANLVLCGNAELARRVPHERTVILPTPIDTARFAPGAVRPGTGKVLGWVGHSDNLAYLETLAEPLREVTRRHPGTRLIVVADRPPKLPGVEIEFREWTLASELSCFDEIAVGLMPLEDSAWSRAKCAFKAIQYMALGIPTVASPVGMNLEVIRNGESGFLPATPRAWIEILDAVLSSPELARRIGVAGRAVVERRYALSLASEALIEQLSLLAAGT